MPYRPTARTQERTARTRDGVLGAARDLLAEGGYRAATVQAVAARAGVATGTVYRHFPSKADLFAEVFRQAAQREVDAVARAGDPGRPVAERIAAAVETFVRRALDEPVRAYALLAEPVGPEIEEQRLIFRRAYAGVFAAALREGIARGELRPLDVDLAAAALVGALGEALVGPLADRSRAPDALAASLTTFCLSAIEAGSTRVRDAAAA